MSIHRSIKSLIQDRLKKMPAVTLLGPRQCGKTTLARSFKGIYLDLEQEGDRLKLDHEWAPLMNSKELVILDEVQHDPTLFSRLRGAIDSDRRRYGRFLMLGSVSPSLMRESSESLAGRTALLELSTFLLQETSMQSTDLWKQGAFPDGLTRFPWWQKDYLRTLAERDLPNWGLLSKPALTQRLFKMLALSHGNVLNISDIARSLGISAPTVAGWLDMLEGAFLIRRLPAFHGNLKKRLVKRSKIYWRDSGLLHALLGLENKDDIYHHPLAGASWEGFVIEQVMGSLNAAGRSSEAYFLRTSDHHEIDLVLELGASRLAVEIKLTSSPSPSDLKRLNILANSIKAQHPILLCRAEHSSIQHGRGFANLADFLKLLGASSTNQIKLT